MLGVFSFVIHQIHISPKQTIIRRVKQTKDQITKGTKQMFPRRQCWIEHGEEKREICYLETGISVTFLCKVKTQGEWTLGYLTGWADCLHSFHWVTQWSIVYVCGRKSDRKRKDWTDKEREQTKKEKTQRTVKQQSYKSVESWGQRSTSY